MIQLVIPNSISDHLLDFSREGADIFTCTSEEEEEAARVQPSHENKYFLLFHFNSIRFENGQAICEMWKKRRI